MLRAATGNEDFIEDVHHQLKNKTIVGKTVTCGSMTVLRGRYKAELSGLPVQTDK